MTLVARLTELLESGGRAVLFTVVEGEGVGSKALVVEGGDTIGDGVPAEALAQFDELVRRGRSRIVEVDGAKVFAEWYGPPPRVLVYGAVDTAEALAQGAKLLGWTAIVADARATFLTPERIPSADQLIPKWPEDAISRIMGPCGLDIGADTQEETALSILSEILAVRAQREGGFLKNAKKRIHVEVE